MGFMILQTLINGIMSGGVYALVAIGITIVFGVMKIINFAMGSYLMVGMYLTYMCYQLMSLETYLLLPFVLVIQALVALVTFKLCVGPSLKRGSSVALLVTLGLGMVIQNVVQVIFGTLPLTVPSSIKYASISIGPLSIAYPRLIALAVTLIVVAFVNYLMNKTLMGRAMRATSENLEVAQILGINAQRIYIIAFVMGITMAGIAGLLLTPVYLITPNVGNIFRTTGIMAVVMGGLGSIKGSLICGLMIGVIESVVATFVAADYGPIGIFILFLIILFVRPQGLFGERGRVS